MIFNKVIKVSLFNFSTSNSWRSMGKRKQCGTTSNNWPDDPTSADVGVLRKQEWIKICGLPDNALKSLPLGHNRN